LTASGGSRSMALSNRSGGITGTADFYAWGLRGSNVGLGATGLRAVGVQSFPDGANTQLVFAVNTFGRASNPVTMEYDVLVDVDGDGTPDYDIVAADLGLLTTGSFNGQMATAVFHLSTGAGARNSSMPAPVDRNTAVAICPLK